MTVQERLLKHQEEQAVKREADKVQAELASTREEKLLAEAVDTVQAALDGFPLEVVSDCNGIGFLVTVKCRVIKVQCKYHNHTITCDDMSSETRRYLKVEICLYKAVQGQDKELVTTVDSFERDFTNFLIGQGLS